MNSNSIDRTNKLAFFVSNTSTDELPIRCLDLATRYVLDTVGVAVFGADMPWSQSAAAYIAAEKQYTKDNTTVIGHTWRTNAASAAFSNGVASHAFELDDVHDESILHPGSVVIPASLAIAEETDATGRDFLAAVVCGYEVMARTGLAVNPTKHMLHGFHPTGMCGVFGATAAAGRLLNLDCAALVSAIGLAASFAGGIMEFSRSGGAVKRFHAGHAAENGIKAAKLASLGVEGPRRGLDGDLGFCHVFSPSPLIGQLDNRLGERFMIDEITVKPYASCSDLHPIIDALLTIQQHEHFDPFQVVNIRIDAPRKVVEQNTLDGTTSIMAAQYSAAYTVALTLLKDIEDPHIYCEETLADNDLATLQERVVIKHEPAFDERYAELISGRVIVEMITGKTYSHTVHGARGSTHQPLTLAEVREKFRRLSTGPLSAADTVKLEKAILGLTESSGIENVAQWLGRAHNC